MPDVSLSSLVGLTPAVVLSKLLTVDGASSGLDADLLDGQEGTYYLDLGNASGTLAVARLPALTGGDVTSSAGSANLSIGNGKVTLPKMADLAANSFIGNNTGSAATPIALTVSQAKTLLALVKADVGLGNVENTALSTWAGSTAITSVGTIGVGTWNGTAIGINKGGTGQVTALAAFDALAPSTTLGDLIFRDTSNTARLAGNVTTTKKFLSQTGTGSASAAPSWSTLAKADVGLGNVDNTSDASKPISTATQSALDTKISSSLIGAANGVAPLGADSKIDAAYLPSYVDDVLEYADSASFPATGETGKLYTALDNSTLWRWSGSTYVDISSTSGNSDTATKWATARTLTLSGKAAGSATFDGSADFSLNVTSLTVSKSDVGLGNVDNTSDVNKPVSTATQTALDGKVATTLQVIAGNGFTGGGALSGNVTLTLGTPGDLNGATTNSVTTNSHTHALNYGSVAAASATDLSKHIALYGTTYGLCVQSNVLNLVSNSKVFAFDGANGDFTLVGDVYANGTKYVGDSKNIIQFSDTLLRLNQAGDFTGGVYTPGVFRADSALYVGASGATFKADSTGAFANGSALGPLESALYTLSGDLTLTQAHSSGTIYNSTTTSRTVTLPATGIAAGTMFQALAFSTGTITFTAAAGGTLYWFKGDGASPATGNRVLARGGWATIVQIAAGTYFISGAGLS